MSKFDKQRDNTSVVPIPMTWVRQEKETKSITPHLVSPLLPHPYLILGEDRYKYISRNK